MTAYLERLIGSMSAGKFSRLYRSTGVRVDRGD